MLAHHNEQQGSEARLRVLAAAVEEFARHGFANARIRSIVEAARVNVAAVNYYFGGKDGLYRATVTSLAVRMDPLDAARVHAIREAPERLRAVVSQLILRLATSEGPTPLARILAHEALAQEKRLPVILEEAMGAELKLLASILRAIAGVEVDDDYLHRRAVGVLGQCVLYLHAAPSVEPEALDILAGQIAQTSAREARRAPAAPVAGK
jgi:AcrR family transcriptional regulator